MTTDCPPTSFRTVYRIVNSRSVIISVCIVVSSVCACCGSFATPGTRQAHRKDTSGALPGEAVALCSGCDQAHLAQPAKPVHRCEATAVRLVFDGTARSERTQTNPVRHVPQTATDVRDDVWQTSGQLTVGLRALSVRQQSV